MTHYTRHGCTLLDTDGMVLERDLVQFTNAALDRMVELLNAGAGTTSRDLLPILEQEAAAGQYPLYYQLDEDVKAALGTRSGDALEAMLAIRLASRVQTRLTAQTYAALKSHARWTHRTYGPKLDVQFEFDGTWTLEPQPDGSWSIIHPGETEAFFLAYTDDDLRPALLRLLADWRYCPEAAQID